MLSSFINFACLVLAAILGFLFFLASMAIVCFLVARWWITQRGKSKHEGSTSYASGKKPRTVAFFHPYCNAGGGGERVLWTAIRALQNEHSHLKFVVYTGDQDVSGEDIMRRARERFNITLPRPVMFVFLKKRQWVEASPYPFFTLLGQSIGSMLLGWEALVRFNPDIYIDTMGYAFTLPLFKYIGKCHVGCYVHYPTISTDMLSKVSDRRATYNNASFITRSRILSGMKLIYYKLFACIYGLAGSCADVVMVNSSWTFGHIKTLWKKDNVVIVYPPCDTKAFLNIPRKDDSGIRSIVSIGQFRPEKDHALQIRSFAQFLQEIPSSDQKHYKLVLVGSCRNQDDADRVNSLQELASQLHIKQNVEFALNVTFDQLKNHLSEATVGLHTMWNEHFGIGVVECMAAGVIALAHNSGGPKMDIVKEWNSAPTGFLADSEETYAKAMNTIFSMQPDEVDTLRKNAKENVSEHFSEAAFETGFLECVKPILDSNE